MNWGYKLILVFVVFGAFMFYMIYRCTQIPVNLVTKEYYKDELVYQEVINGHANARKLTSRVKLVQNGDIIDVTFPDEQHNAALTGTIWFYRPENNQMDKKIPIEIGSGGIQKVGSSDIIPGRYKVKIDWKDGKTNYYQEGDIYIQ